MNANILETDYFSKLYALQEPQAALVLFGFKAAFPSILQSFMWKMLARIGLPSKWVRLLQRLYEDNRQQIGPHED